MARSFGGASYIAAAETLNPGITWTMCVIASHNSIANSACALMLSLTNTSQGTVENSISCYFRGDTVGDPVQNRYVDNGVGSTSTNSSTGYSANTPTSIVVRSNSTTSLSVFKDGVKGTDGTTAARDGFSASQLTIGVGIIFNAIYQEYITGDACMVGLWNATLTDAECISLGKGFPPRRVRPQSLIRYLPLVRDAIDVKKGGSLTLSGTPPGVSAHPRCYGF